MYFHNKSCDTHSIVDNNALTVTVDYTVLYCTVLYYTVLYCTVLYCTVLYCTVLYTVLYCTVLYYFFLPFINFFLYIYSIFSKQEANNTADRIKHKLDQHRL